MPLVAGDKLGPYEILSPLGAGGMGEVYKARDTRLNRIVAIKVSKEQFSERFEREAQAVAALNHSNICTLYDVGPNYLVMEYIEGTPPKGPLPLDQALKYAVQICDALNAAHKKGITHRDLKPANILITKAGIKLLDFGLAKLSTAAQTAEPLNDTTLTMALTGKNEIVGTLYYMSPEQLQAQANGQEIDARSDIFSFGLVLYEMLTGKRAFAGSSPASVIAAIMERPAPSIADIAPAVLDRILRKCLAKDPDERWQSARDLKDELEWVANGSAGVAEPALASSRTTLRLSRIAWIAGVMTAVALFALWAPWRENHLPSIPSVRVDLDTGANLSPFNIGTDAILSPDASTIVFVGEGSDGGRRLFARRLDQSNAIELRGTNGAIGPFFSPDGQWVAFFAGGKLKKTSVDGGTPISLADAPAGRGGSWGEDGTIVAALDQRAGLMRVPSEGGTPSMIVGVRAGENSLRWPQVLPGGKAVLFGSNKVLGNFDESNIEVVSLADGRRRAILEHAGMPARYVPSGHLVFVNKGTLYAVPFDLARMEVRGKPAPVLEEVVSDSNYGSAQMIFANNGTLLYRRGRTVALHKLDWMDASGNLDTVAGEPAKYQFPRVSPDGTRIAVVVTDSANSVLWIYDWQRGSKSRLTIGPGVNTNPVWSPDGRYLIFQAPGGIWWARADGAGQPQTLIGSDSVLWPGSFTGDGKRMVFSELDTKGGSLIKTASVSENSGQPVAGRQELYLQVPGSSATPAFSPDGRWLAYADAESGSYEVYVRAFPDTGTKWQISTAGGGFPVWSRNKSELYYRTEEQEIMVAAYSVQGERFSAEQPRRWSPKRMANIGLTPNLDITPDSKRMVAVMPAEDQQFGENQRHVVLVLNFFDELRRKVPVGK